MLFGFYVYLDTIYILYIAYYLQGFSFDSYTLFDENTFIKNIEVECATILRKNPRLRLLKGILFCVLKIQNGKVIRYDVIFSAFNQQRSKNIQPEPGIKQSSYTCILKQSVIAIYTRHILRIFCPRDVVLEKIRN